MKTCISKARLAVLPLALAAAFSGLAQTQLKEVVVTANRYPVSADETFQSVSVISRQMIDVSGSQTLLDLLVVLPGVNVVRNGGAGKVSSILLRGSNSNQVLVLVDGVRASTASSGEFDWNSINPVQIDRIELVRGPLASLYGSDALAGVIHIFTRSASKGFSFSQTLGSFGTRATELGFGGGEDWRYGLSLGTSATDGIQTLVKYPERFGFYQEHANLTLTGKLTNDLQLSAGTTYAQGRNSLEASSGSSDFINQISSLKLEHKVSNQWTHSVNVGYAVNSMDVAGGYTPGKLETNRKSFSWINNFNLPSGVMTLGLDRWLDRAIKTDYANSAANLDNNLSTTGLFTQYTFNAMGLEWQTAARADKHNVYGSQTTYNAAVGKKLASGWSWNASRGTAFKAPTTNDLFWPHSSYPNSDWSTGDPLTYPGTCGPLLATPCSVDESGNSGVKPERSKTTELSLRYQGDISIAANLYETRINDLIQWDTRFDGVGSAYTQYWYPNNVKEALMRGLEISFNKKIHAWSFDGHYTRLLATDVNRAEQLDRRPKNSASISVTHSRADLTTGIELVMASDRLDNSGTSSLAGYGVVNLKSTYALSREWSVHARIENILDKSYTLATYAGNNYATPGPSGYLTLRYVPH